MIIVSVFRPEARTGDADGYHVDDPFDGTEIFGVFPDADGQRMVDILDNICKLHPGWKFEIDAGPQQSNLDEAVRNVTLT